MAIVATWGGQSPLQGAWRLPLGLLLIGMAYERWRVQRLGLEVQITATHCRLGKPCQIHLRFSHAAPRAVPLQVALDAPEGVDIVRSILELRVGPGELSSSEVLSATARRLGTHTWPALRVRAAGALGLAWWTRSL